MPPPSLTFDQALDQAWQTLERRLRLLKRFGYIVFFVRDGRLAQALKTRTAAWLAQREWPWADVAEQGAEDFSQRTLASLFEQLRAGTMRLAWLEAHRGGGQVDWDAQRQELLSRLNERRSRLEKELPGAFILLLPEDGLRDAATLAPDLWHVRLHTASLRADESPSAEPAGFSAAPRTGSAQGPSRAGSGQSRRYWAEQWRSVFADTPVQGVAHDDPRLLELSLHDAFAAVNEELVAGHLDAGRALADEVLDLARWRLELASNGDEKARLLRTLSLALGLAGDAAYRQGDLERARASYAESVRIRRDLALLQPFAAEALRDLSVGIDKLARLELAQGKVPSALEAFEESLALSRDLLRREGDTPQATRDLLVSLNNVGEAALQLGDLTRAAQVYEASLSLSREQARRLGGGRESLRDLSVALDRYGQVAQAQGDMARAAAVYEEGLKVTRELAAQTGETPEMLHDLVISLNSVSRVARAQADWARARSANDEALHLARELVRRWPDMPSAWEDFAITLVEASWHPAADGPALRSKAEQILADLLTRYPDVAVYAHRLRTLRAWMDQAPMAQNTDSSTGTLT